MAIADAFPHIKCTVLDLPHVIDNLKGTNNLDFVEGDMFEKIPPANATLLKVQVHTIQSERSFFPSFSVSFMLYALLMNYEISMMSSGFYMTGVMKKV